VYNFGVEFITIMMHQFDVIVERDSVGYFVASVLALPACHTPSKSLDDLMERIRPDGAHPRNYRALSLGQDEEAPEQLDFVCIQRITVAA
jgi:hypothetical protein